MNENVIGVIGLQDIIKPGIQERFERLRKMGADKGARAQAQLQIEVKAGVEDVLAQQTVLLGLPDGGLQPLDGDGVLGPDVDVKTDVIADGVVEQIHILKYHSNVAQKAVAGHLPDVIAAHGDASLPR